MQPEIIFEDAELLVINKPSGMIVNKAESVKKETVQGWFNSKIKNQNSNLESEFWQKGGVVHRLDKDTSGVMVLGKTEPAYNFLKEQFLTRQTVKKYLALVHGNFDEDKGLITASIERHPKIHHKFTIGGDLARSAITEWQVEQRFKNYTLLELTPHTGRTHQLRVHLQSIQHPIISDPIYGWKKQLADDLAFCPRLFLHAKSLSFVHPSGQRLQFEAPLPSQLQQVLSHCTLA